MMTGSANEKQKRSWTDRPEESRNRLGAMVFLGLSALSLLSLFVWIYFFRPTPARSFVAKLSIKNYQKDVPEIRLGEWDLVEMSKIEGVIPWEKLPSGAKFENEKDVKQFFSNLNSFKTLDKQKDTVLIQLRCHAAVTNQNSDDQKSDNWSCGLYINDDFTANRSFPFSTFLDLAAKVPAKNVVVFAEVADLQFEPHLGWVVNPIEHYIRKACKDVDWKNQVPGKNVWIVCSNADYQSPLFSVKRAKTLFQEACEESLKEEALSTGRKKALTLARYFELIYRHCHTASEGRQTPRLILANKSDDELPRADEVFVSSHKAVISPPKSSHEKLEKKKAEESPPAKEAQNRIGNRTVPVSFRQTDAKAAQDPKSAKSVELDPGLRFWQIRDEIEARGVDKNLWSPRDFAPFAWRKLQADVAMASIWHSKDGKTKTLIEDQTKAVEMLLDSLTNGSKAKLEKDMKGTQWDIVDAWNDFRGSNSNFRRQWQDDISSKVDPSTGLIGSEIEEWQKQRSEFRSYVDCVAELSQWIEFSAEFATAQFEDKLVAQLKTVCKELISTLAKAKLSIPRESTQSSAEFSINLRLEEARKIKESLHAKIEDAIHSSNLIDSKSDLTWLEERKYQVLLSSPLLKYEQRRQIVKAWKSRQPNKVVAKTDPDFKSIQPPKPVAQVAEVDSHCELLQHAWPLLSDQPLPVLPKDSKGLLVWGKEYNTKTLKLVPSQLQAATNAPHQSVALWHFLSLVDPRFASTLQINLSSNKSWHGIVVAPIDPKTIRLSLDPPFLDFQDRKSDLRIKVVHFDGTDVPPCSLKWLSSSGLKSFSVMHEDKAIKIGDALDLVPKGKQIILNCNLSSEVTPESGSQIKVSVSATLPTGKIVSSELTIPVFRNADRIDLVARRVGVPVQLKEIKGNLEKKEPYIELESPAISGATSQFSFSLSNKKNAARSVGLKVYVSPSLHMPSKINDKLIAIAEFETELAAMQETLVELKSIVPKEPLAQLEIDDVHNSMLVFEIIEFEMDDPKKEKADKTPKKGSSWRYLARFKPIHPGKFVKPNPGRVEANTKYSIQFNAEHQEWQRYGLNELPISIRAQTWSNGALSQEKPLMPLLLKRDEASGEVVGDIADQNLRRFSADIGGFPRAIVFEASPSSPDMTRWDDDQVQIKRFRPILFPVQGAGDAKAAEVSVKEVKGQFVFPTRIRGEEVKLRAIEISTVVDKGPNSKIQFEILKVEGSEEKRLSEIRELPSDRSYATTLSIKDGALVVGYVPGELKIRYSESIGNLDGAYVCRIRVGEQKDEKRFIFDKVPPTSAFVNAEGAIPNRTSGDDTSKMQVTLFKGDSVDIWIEAVDTAGVRTDGTGIDTAVFKLCSRSTKDFNESADPPLTAKVTPSEEGRASMKLTSSEFEGRTKGAYWIVAKTMDHAGNIQNVNQPLKVNWMDTPKPAPPK